MTLLKLHTDKPRFKPGSNTIIDTSRPNTNQQVDGFVKKVRENIEHISVQYVKNDAKKAVAAAVSAIPDTGTGYTAKQTVVTTGKVKATPSREEAKRARARLRRRRGGISGVQEKQKALQRGIKKIDRTQEKRLAWLITKGKTVFRIGLASYYSASIKLKSGKTLRQEVVKKLNELKVKR